MREMHMFLPKEKDTEDKDLSDLINSFKEVQKRFHKRGICINSKGAI